VQPSNVVFAASEAHPFCKTGGLADVVGALSEELTRNAPLKVTAFLPLYRDISRKKFSLKKINRSFHLTVGKKKFRYSLWRKKVNPRLHYYFLECPALFNRKGLYGYASGSGFEDNHIRFSFFSWAVLHSLKELNLKTDLFHCHDWQSGLLPVLLKTVYKFDPFYQKSRSLFTIHNMAYQGRFSKGLWGELGLPRDKSLCQSLEIGNQISFLKGALIYSDLINTVSPTYKKEIMGSKIFSYGLEKVLKKRRNNVFSVLNGLNTRYWNPANDPYLKTPYSWPTVSRRNQSKTELQKVAGFPQNPQIPLLGFVGRLDHQKGIDLLLKSAPKLLKNNCQFVFLGKGDIRYEKRLRALERKTPRQIYVDNKFSEPLAHKIYAGSDLFMMPSQYEPCGLGQMIALRYGAIPVVTPTGGLLDTVWDASTKKGNGVVCKNKSTAGFLDGLQRGLTLCSQNGKRRQIQMRGMKSDFSWTKSKRAYLKLYETAFQIKDR